MQQLTARQLKEWLEDPARGKPVLVDVREPWELEVCRLPGVRPMPMRSVPARYLELERDAETVIVCHHGARSFQVGMFLEHQGFSRIFNLYGGMAAWSQDADPATPTY
jgi:rhodanese-related sulfurtransferase